MSIDRWFTAVVDGIVATDLITWLATITAILYVLLALKESAWCWLFGILTSALSVITYFNQQLWYESILNVIYVLLGIYGWVIWVSRKNSDNTSTIITKMKKNNIAALLIVGAACSYLLGKWSEHNTTSTLPYADASITTFSIIATWMTAKKYLENWIVWIVADAFAAVVYYYKGPEMYLFTLLFVFYTIMAVSGYIVWKKKTQASNA